MSDFWIDLQVFVISKTTHSSVHWHSLILQRGFNFWLLRQLLSTEGPSDLPPPIFAQNYHQVQPTVLYFGIVSDLREVSIADCWDIYYRSTNQILTDLPPPDCVLNFYQVEPTVFSVPIGSDVTKVSIAIFLDIFIDQILTLSSTPCFCAGFSSGKTHSSVHWNSLSFQRDVICWLLEQLLLTDQILD